MVGPQYDFLANPLGAVRSTFDAAIASGSDPSSFDGRDWGALNLFRHFLFDQSRLSQVPVLTPATIRCVKPNTLVRFRGMIQDMLGNEFYVGAYKDGSVWRTNKFMDVSQFPMGSSSDMRIWERRLLYCVPVPGLNQWTEISAEAVGNQSMDLISDQREKRRRAEDESSDMHVSDDEVQDSPNTKKLREGEHSSRASQSQGAVPEIAGSSMSLVPGFYGNSPPCLVKIYDSPESELKLNDIFEFVGILTSDPELQDDNEGCDLSNELCEDPLRHFPPNKVPRLHCFIHRKLAVQDFLQNNPIVEPKPDLVKGIREALLRHLTAVLGNDDLAAHFMLLHLLSKVHARVDALAVGKLSLNFTCFNKETVSVFGKQINLALKNLVPFTLCIPLTVEYLNTASVAPKKNYDTNRLETGVLQLAEGSHLIVDETKLEAGTLNSVGVENARLLKNLMELQKVEYDFKYYKMEMATDVQLLVLSEGKSNILPADVIVPFRPAATNCSEVVTIEALEAWRWYLATVRQLSHSIESEMQKVVENDLVAARQADRSLNPQDLSRWLTMGRLMSLSYGETSLSLEHWQMVKELERLRRERLK
ncbi:mini-chromosome maintenance complex-binding protein isoform X2 [Abrus precatorius]|uniref:Mini-chromosome maintenance complex-binding protein isoform X2 n=1 Tax=Abrus precatorius TaxID=3816 RepID=A0A8B8K540_ABRPR|nr:mini-chromosome maintenance complex-binding protein isoform X2 [Abrus precatorius]